MPNHVHLTRLPEHIDALRSAVSKVQRAFAGRVHAREERTGHFWQGRFGSVAMDEPHLLAALHYVATNPAQFSDRPTQRAPCRTRLHTPNQISSKPHP